MEEKYDLIVLGGGPAGYAGAMRALDFGKKVCLIEKEKIGGAAIYKGVMTSKTMWEVGLKIQEINENNKKIHCHMDLSWADLQKRVQENILSRAQQYEKNAKIYAENLTILQAEGVLIDKNTIALKKKGQMIGKVQSDFILIATGSKPRILPHIPVDGKTIFTSDHIEELADYPESLVIVGAGVIGCEFATIFSSLGKTKVYLIDRAKRILPFEDEDLSHLVAKNLETQGVTIHHNAHLLRMEKTPQGHVEYEIAYENGKKETIKVQKALLSIGREAIVEGIGLETVGVAIHPKTKCIEDIDTQTNIPTIYAAGDVSGKIALVNVGEIEARHAVEKMFGNSQKTISYDNLCSIMFLNPEVAAVGLNELQCIEKNIPIKVVKMDYSLIPRAIAMQKTQGFFKIIVTNDEEMKILGMRAIGEHASSAIQAIGLMIKTNKSIRELSELIHPHPSIIEGIQECVRLLLNRSIFKSNSCSGGLQCYTQINGVKKDILHL